jgi:hypothetical protein
MRRGDLIVLQTGTADTKTLAAEGTEASTEKPHFPVTPAKAGVQNALKRLDFCIRGNDEIKQKMTFSANC